MGLSVMMLQVKNSCDVKDEMFKVQMYLNSCILSIKYYKRIRQTMRSCVRHTICEGQARSRKINNVGIHKALIKRCPRGITKNIINLQGCLRFGFLLRTKRLLIVVILHV